MSDSLNSIFNAYNYVNAPIFLIAYPDFDLIYSNRTAAKLSGYPLKSKFSFLDFFPDLEKKKVEDMVEAGFDIGIFTSFGLKFRRKSGRLLSVDISGSVIKDNDLNILVLSVHDITYLDKQIFSKVKDIQTILLNIKNGIFTFGGDLKIHQEYSRHLSVILGQEELVGAVFTDILFRNSNVTLDQKEQIVQALKFSFDESIFQFNVNNEVLPLEMTRNLGSQVLSLDWIPIEDQDQIVRKIMLTVRDVTELRSAELEARKSALELKMVGQILAIDPVQFDRLIRQSSESMHHALELITKYKSETKNLETVHTIFRSLHTLKGNARIYGLVELSYLVHAVENELSLFLLKPNSSELNISSLRAGIKSIIDTQNEYERIKRVKLERSANSNLEVWSHINELLSKQDLSEVKKIVQSKLSVSLKELLVPLFERFAVLATKNSHPTPVVEFYGKSIKINSNFIKHIEEALIHIINNFIEHGLLPDKVGKLNVRAVDSEAGCIVQFDDNGPGLNLARLREKAKTLGVALNGESDVEVAQLIFHSGLSTAMTVTTGAGRGVGMDAVKSTLTELGGSAKIVLTPPSVEGSKFRPFQLELYFPNAVLSTSG